MEQQVNLDLSVSFFKMEQVVINELMFYQVDWNQMSPAKIVAGRLHEHQVFRVTGLFCWE